MEATYQLNESELTEQFLHGLKETFKGKRVTISVMAQGEHAMSREALEAKIVAAEESPVYYLFEGNQFDELVDKTLAGEPVDTDAYKRTNQ